MNCKLTKFLFVLIVLGTLVAVRFIAPFEPSGIEAFGWHAAHPIAFLFQILFFLFIISPPLIVVMLYLIWKELKECNKMK
jgi:uncharacterized membrane protein